MAHLWDACKPLSVLSCRPKVSAEAVCKEKVWCSGNQVAIAGKDSVYNLTGVVKYLVTWG